MARADKNTTTSATLTGGAPAPSAVALCPHCGQETLPVSAPEDSDQAHRALIAKVGVGVDMNGKTR